MPDDSREQDAEIIFAAYAETLREAFRVFAENVGMGQNPKNCQERFMRSLDLLRKSRDLALEAANGLSLVEPTKAAHETGDDGGRQNVNLDISAEDQAMIDKVLDTTTGNKPLNQPLQRR